MSTNEINFNDQNDAASFNWSADAPRGGKAVMNRILKENATVPLFFAQTLISSLRDVGYNHTTSALCEHVDNAIEAGASEIRVYFHQIGKRGQYEIDAAVYDNGRGMAPNVLKVATSFGGSMNYDNRKGIGRFGMGMKTAALSMCPVMELYSWQEKGAIYNMTLDVEEIGRERSNLIGLPEPELVTELPDELADIFIRPMVYPKDPNEQELLASSKEELVDRLGKSGSIVFMPNCDRLTHAKAQTLADHAVKEMARVYRRSIANGVKIYINNRQVEAFDPTYSMATARHARFLDASTKQSRLVVSKSIEVSIQENGPQKAPITIKLYKLPIEEWSALPRKTLKNDLRVFEGLTVSIMRNDREVFAGALPEITTRHSITHWYRLQIDFPGVLDEAFGIAANKQGVRMKGYVLESIKKAIGEEITTIINEIRHFQAAQASARVSSKPSASEAKASEADPFQAKPLEENLTPEEQSQIDANLRGLAVTLKREGESEDEAFERVKSSKYIINFRHDDYWPFYHVEHQFGRIIMTINTAHPFFTQLYEPVRQMQMKMATTTHGEDAQEIIIPEAEQGPTMALELLLLSLARTQSLLANGGDENRKLLENFRREWSEAYRIQLTT